MASAAGPGWHPGRPPDPAAAAGPVGWSLLAASLPQLVDAHHGLLYLVLQLLAALAPCQPLAESPDVTPDQRVAQFFWQHDTDADTGPGQGGYRW